MTRVHQHIGYEKVQTLVDEGSQSIAARSLHQYKLGIACLYEVRQLKKLKFIVKE